MKSEKKRILKVILGILAVFSLLNVSWYIWRKSVLRRQEII